METKFDVSIDREKWIGGSDIPAIMGISPFTTRFDLLLFKAQLLESDFSGNEYTRYGQIMEPKIRDYINKKFKTNYSPSKHELKKEAYRCHTDGENKDSILEIKTTSVVHKRVNTYKNYLVQLLFYMMCIKKKKGRLVVYERPKDFDETFDENRLQIFDIDIKDYEDLVEDIKREVEQFKIDLEIVKNEPLISEEELKEGRIC
jgi:putative phage-type endonuclease